MNAEQAIDAAGRLGDEHGRNAGSWVIDGNTGEAECRRILNGYEDGDPSVLGMCPNPLSGEYADDLNPRGLSVELGLDWQCLVDDGALCEAYETAFADAWWLTVIHSASYQLDEVA